MRHRKDTTHDLLPAEMNTFGGRQPLRIVAEDGRVLENVGYSCCIRGVEVLDFSLPHVGGIIPDHILIVPSLGRVWFVEAKSPPGVRKKKERYQPGQLLLKSLVGDLFRDYENSEQARRLLLEITDNLDYDDWRVQT